MNNQKDGKYYITTAIDYPNAPPHLGHSLEKVAADIIARYHRLQGYDTYFSIGLDENSQHVVKAAREHLVDIPTWIDSMDEAFRLAWERLEISNDYWIRTSDERHFHASQEMFRRAQENGDIYKSVYSGWYCPNDNTFYRNEDLVNGRCPNHPTIVPEWVEEENYFFALSKYADRLLEHIKKNPDFIVPAIRQAEVVATIQQGLRDFAVSRLANRISDAWGIPVPGDPSQVIYVWFDALTNYITAAGFPDDMAKFAYYWPADAHVIGKDITRFHCLYWPAMLMSAGLPLPRHRHALVSARARHARSPVGMLTPREREILGEMAQGKNNAAIAHALVLSERAVEKQRIGDVRLERHGFILALPLQVVELNCDADREEHDEHHRQDGDRCSPV